MPNVAGKSWSTVIQTYTYAGRKSRIDLSVVAAPELTLNFAFPGDRLALFVRGSYDFLLPIVKSKDECGGNVAKGMLYTYPSLSVGLTFAPTGGGPGYAAYKAEDYQRIDYLEPIKLPSMTEVTSDKKPLNAVWEARRDIHLLLEKMRRAKAQDQIQASLTALQNEINDTRQIIGQYLNK
jgi:hypothetical protein